MWDTFIGRQIRRSSRNLLIWNGLMLAGIVLIFTFTAQYWYNFFLGPFPLSRDAALALQTADVSEYFVEVDGDFCQDTGVVYWKSGKRGRKYVGGKYLALDLKDAWLVVKAKASATPAQTWRGALRNATNEDHVNLIGWQQLQNRVGPRRDGRRIIPVVVDASNFRLFGYIGLAVLVPVGLLNVWNLFKAVSRLSNMDSHPICDALRKYGDPAEVAEKIETEHQSEDKIQFGKSTLTRSWLVNAGTFQVQLVFLGDAAWVYKTVTQHYHNGVPTGKSYAGQLCDIHGSQVTVTLKNETECDDFVAAVAERVPWILAGFTPEWEDLWKKNKPALYEIVEQNRRTLMEDLRREREEGPREVPGEPP